MLPLVLSLTDRSLFVAVDRIIHPRSPCTTTNLRRTKAIGKFRLYMCVFLPVSSRRVPLPYPLYRFTSRADRISPQLKSPHTALPNPTCRPPTTPLYTRAGENGTLLWSSRWKKIIFSSFRYIIPGFPVSIFIRISFLILISSPVFLSSPWTMVIVDMTRTLLHFRDLIMYNHYLLLTAHDMR